MTRRDFFKTSVGKMETKTTTTEDLTNEIQDLGYVIHDLKNSIDNVAGELFALVKTLEKNNK